MSLSLILYILFLALTGLLIVALSKQRSGRQKARREYILEEDDGNLVRHAVYELHRIGEDPDIIDWYVRVIREFASFRHTEGTLLAPLPVLAELLQLHPLTPLTDNPSEWIFHDEDIWGEAGGVWQNKRNGEAFSHDGGKSYYLLGECTDESGYPLHVSDKSS